MSEMMRAVVIDGLGGVEVKEIPRPVAQAGWVTIAPIGTGVCGTDLHLIDGDYPHGKYPVVPGHEFAGYITSVGAGVTGLSDGDYVGVNPNISCGNCSLCLRGATNLCVKLHPVGVSVDGSCAEEVAVPSEIVHRLNTSITHAAAPLIEPFACVLHALERVPDWADQEMVIYGAGSIGLMALILARAEGASGVRVVEPNPTRRQAALKFGAAEAVASGDELSLDAFDLALDASGHPAAIAQAVQSLAPRGRLVQMGVASPSASIPLSPYDIFAKEISIIGSNSLANKYAESAERMVDLQTELSGLVTATFSLEQYSKALIAAKSPEHIKVVVA